MISHSLKDWLLLGLVGGGCGAYCAYYIWSAIEAWAAIGWPSVAGEITASAITSTPARLGSYYEPTVAYVYAVFGVTHTGTRLRFGDNQYNFESSAKKRLAPYAVGTSVQVRYHPDDPTRSVLVPGVELLTYYSIFASAAIFILAAGVLSGVLH
jgi:hypothetical protein